MTYLQQRQRAAKRNNNGLLFTSSFGFTASTIGYLTSFNLDYCVIGSLMGLILIFAMVTRNK